MKTLKSLMLMLLLVTGSSVFAEGEVDSPKDCNEHINSGSITQADTTSVGGETAGDTEQPADVTEE